MGYRTKQGDLILECLKERRSQHATAEDILTDLKARGASVGQTTVYRNLDKLVRQGVVVRYTGPEGQGACFQYAGCPAGSHAHYHLVCSNCGQMIHLECNYMDDLTAHMLEHHQFCVDKFRTVIYGLCKQCAAKRQP